MNDAKIQILGDLMRNLFTDQARIRFMDTPDEGLISLVDEMISIPPGAPKEITSWSEKLSFLIADRYSKLRDEYDKMLLNPEAEIGKIVDVQLVYKPEIILHPLCILARIESSDYERGNRHNCWSAEGMPSYGTTVFFDSLEEILRGRLTLVNLGGDPGTARRADYLIAATEKHEILHSWFSLIREIEGFPSQRLFRHDLSSMYDPADLKEHMELASKRVKDIFEFARSEVVSYFSTGITELEFSSMFGSRLYYLKEDIRDFLEDEKVDPLTASIITGIYDQLVNERMEKFEAYREAAFNLYTNGTCPVLCPSGLDALVILTPLEDYSTLRSYINPNPPLKKLPEAA